MSFPARLETARRANPPVSDVLAGQQAIFETRRQVFQSQAAVNREKRLQVEKEIEGLKNEAHKVSLPGLEPQNMNFAKMEAKLNEMKAKKAELLNRNLEDSV